MSWISSLPWLEIDSITNPGHYKNGTITGDPTIERRCVLTEEFFGLGAGYLSGDSWVGIWHWTGRNADDGPWRGVASEAGHPGIAQVQLSTAPGTNSVSASGSFTAEVPIIDIGDVAWMRFICRIANVAGTGELTLTSYGIGLIQVATDAEIGGTTPNMGGNGLALFKPGDLTTWGVRRETASASSSVVMAAAVTSSWVECILVDQGSGRWECWLNGTKYSDITGVATTGLMYPAFWISSTGTGEKLFDVDLFQIGCSFKANRFG